MAVTKPAKSNDAYRQLKADIAAGSLKNLYLLHGEEVYLRDYYLGQMKQKLLPEGTDSFNYHSISGKACSAQVLSELVDALPMMCERTMIVATDFDLFKAPEAERKALEALFSDLPDYCCLVFVYDTIAFKADARMKSLSAALKSTCQVVDFQRQSQADLIAWLSRRFRALGHEIDASTAQYLIFLCGDLMTSLISETGKIGAYAKEVNITQSDIDAVAIPQIDAVVFQMTDALTRRQFDKAAGILGDLLHMQEPPIRILAVVGRHFRQLLSARIVLDSHKDVSYLAAMWSMRSSYGAQKLMQSARHFSPSWCRWAVRRCGETDLAMKSVVGADSEALLVSLLLELSAKEAFDAAH